MGFLMLCFFKVLFKKIFWERLNQNNHPKVTSCHLTLPHLTTVPTDKFKDSIHLGV